MKNLLSSNTQLHHLTINDRNLFVSLGQRIRQLKEKVSTTNKIVLLPSEKQKRSKARPQIDNNLLHLVQPDSYGSITAKANTIDQVVVS
jgi:hypothetical protein